MMSNNKMRLVDNFKYKMNPIPNLNLNFLLHMQV